MPSQTPLQKAADERELSGLLTMLVFRAATPKPIMDKIDGQILALTIKLDQVA
jgi:hypothetical protein